MRAPLWEGEGVVRRERHTRQKPNAWIDSHELRPMIMIMMQIRALAGWELVTPRSVQNPPAAGAENYRKKVSLVHRASELIFSAQVYPTFVSPTSTRQPYELIRNPCQNGNKKNKALYLFKMGRFSRNY